MADRIYSDLPAKAYLAALKSNLKSPLSFLRERVTGIVIGPFFSVAHHCEFDWNRRITCECNRAIGFVRTVDGRTEVNFVRSRGYLSPFWLLFFTLLFYIFAVIMVRKMDFAWLFASVILSVIMCAPSAFEQSLTKEGQEGAGQVTKLLLWPDQY